MSKPDFDPLLNDLLADSGYNRFRADLKQQALGAFRRARFWRRTCTAGAFAAVACLAVGTLLWQTQRAGSPTRTVHNVAPAESVPVPRGIAPVPPSNASIHIETISDEQLLAAFPPGSCFLAELNGQTILVFHDPALRAEVMR